MASITKTTTMNGGTRYRVRWRVDGRTVERWTPTLAAARALKTQAESDALTGIPLDPQSGARLLNDYFTDWVASRLLRGRPLSPTTRIGYERLWRRTVEADLGRNQLRALRPESIRSWHADVTIRAGSDQAAKAYRLVRAVLATAEADEFIRINPCRIRGGGQEHHQERPMVDTSLVLRLAETIEPRYRALVLVAGFAGLRTGESLGLRRCDVDLLHGELRVIAHAQEVAGHGRMLLEPKSEAGRRVVAIPSIVVEALDSHLATFTVIDASAWVFTGPSGTPLRRATFSKAWRRAVAATGGPSGLRAHDLRHHAATLTARMPGVTTKELMARIGHASSRAALIYQHATAERDHAIASYLDQVVADTRPQWRAPIVGLPTPDCGAGVGLEPDGASPPFGKTGPDQHF